MIASQAFVAATIKGAIPSMSMSGGVMLGRDIELDVKLGLLPEKTGSIPLNRSAGRFWQGARTNQNDLPDCNLVLIHDGFANRSENFISVKTMTPGAFQLMDDHQYFVVAFVHCRKSGPAIAAERWMAVMRRVLNVLRIMIVAAD